MPTKADVEAAFGKVSNILTSKAEVLRSLKTGESFSWRQEATEEIAFPKQGLSFTLKTNVVTSFEIYRKPR
jgi:hypothetical protein